VALKKNRCGTSPVSKVSNNEHTTAALGHSEVLSVKHSVGPPIPEFDHAPKYGTKVPSSVAGQDPGDVLPNHPSGPLSVSKPKKLKDQVATVVIQSASQAGDAERLAGGSSDKKVNCCILICSYGGEIAVQWHAWIVMR
jgi:hypothetical protein